MGGTGRALVALTALAIIIPALAASVSAEVHSDVYLLRDKYTAEGSTTKLPVELKGEEIIEARFNFTVRDDILNSDEDYFLFLVENVERPDMRQSFPGNTGETGVLHLSFPFTQAAPPRWSVSVSCTEAGDTMIGTFVWKEDNGNNWSLQVDYLYWVADGGDGNGGGGGGSGSGGQPLLVRVTQTNLVLVLLLSILALVMSVRLLRGEGRLIQPYAVGALLLADAFFMLPVVLLVNQHENGVFLTGPPLGPGWLGNLAVVMLVLWIVPLVVAKRRWLTSETTHHIIERVIGEGVADRVHARGDGFAPDPLSERGLSLLMAALGMASVVVAALMLVL